MKKKIIQLLPVLLVGLLAACAISKKSYQMNPHKSPDVSEQLSQQELAKSLPELETRWYSELHEQLIPCADYGILVPFQGNNPENPNNWGTGLMTLTGKVVLDPVLEQARVCGYLDNEGNKCTLPVIEMTKPGHEQEVNGVIYNHSMLYAFAAQDGNWVTGFDYLGSIPFPNGLAVGDSERLYILDPNSGAELRSWTWEELKLSGAWEVFSLGPSGGFYYPQWCQGGLYLGDNGKDAWMLDPETGIVTISPAQEIIVKLIHLHEELSQKNISAQIQENGTIFLEYQGQEYCFDASLPQDNWPWVTTQGRVIFNGKDGRCTVLTLEGDVILPIQEGTASEFQSETGNGLLGVCSNDYWQLYDQDGNALARITEDSQSVTTSALPLVFFQRSNYFACYNSITGECFFRSYK